MAKQEILVPLSTTDHGISPSHVYTVHKSSPPKAYSSFSLPLPRHVAICELEAHQEKTSHTMINYGS